MNNIRVTMSDASTGATTSKSLQVDDAKLAKFEKMMMYGTMIPQFTSGVRFLWTIEELEIL